MTPKNDPISNQSRTAYGLMGLATNVAGQTYPDGYYRYSRCESIGTNPEIDEQNRPAGITFVKRAAFR